jgi:hypothetical protein
MKLKELIEECIQEIIKEDLNIPSNDGTANGASEEDKDKAKNATKNGQSVDFVKPGEIEEAAIEKDEAHQKVIDVYQSLKDCEADISELEDFANESGNPKMKKLTADLADHILKSNEIIAQLKEMKDDLLQEEAEKASSFGDKVIKALGKFFKKEGSAEKMKKKYMPFISKAFQKGKSAKEVADRIKDHRFEI